MINPRSHKHQPIPCCWNITPTREWPVQLRNWNCRRPERHCHSVSRLDQGKPLRLHLPQKDKLHPQHILSAILLLHLWACSFCQTGPYWALSTLVSPAATKDYLFTKATAFWPHALRIQTCAAWPTVAQDCSNSMIRSNSQCFEIFLTLSTDISTLSISWFT